VIGYLALVRILRYRNMEALQRLDPTKDFWEIMDAWSTIEQPSLTELALNLALVRTFAIPSISRLIDKTQQFAQKTIKRYEDTDIIMREISENDIDSKRCSLAIQRLNYIHSLYQIPNEDFLFVLSLFIYEPLRWAERYGWRTMTSTEVEAHFQTWRSIGYKMNIKDIPLTREAFKKYKEDYEKEFMIYAPSNVAVWKPILRMFLEESKLISLGEEFGNHVFNALIPDDRLRCALGYQKPNALFSASVYFLLRMTQFVTRYLLLPRPKFFTARRTPTCPVKQTASLPVTDQTFVPYWNRLTNFYKKGYSIPSLGPKHALPGNLYPMGTVE